MSSQARTSMRLVLPLFGLARLIMNSGYRLVYPFLPVIARGLDVDIQVLALAVSARSIMAMGAPFLGTITDNRGRKVSLVTSTLIFAASTLLILAWPTYAGFVAALVIGSLAKSLFDPAMHAYIGDRVQYAQRGFAIAIAELSWSASFLFGMPLIGWIMSQGGWFAPFPWLAGGAIVAGLLIWKLLPSDSPPIRGRTSVLSRLGDLVSHPQVRAGLAVGLLIGLANEIVGIIYGVWMEQSFGLQVAALGAASAVIGFAELGGEGLVASIVDRMGKRRSVAVGIVLNTLVCLTMPVIGSSLSGALISLFFFYLTFEFTIVSAIPLITELALESRASILAGNLAALSAGRAVGALLGPALFSIGIAATTTAAAIIDVSALACLLLFIHQE